VDARSDIKPDVDMDLHLDMTKVHIFDTAVDQENLTLENL
jgi:hypothetical protein